MHHYFWTKSFKTPEKNKSSISIKKLQPSAWRVRIIVWGNVLFQLLFPLSLSFTPVIAATLSSSNPSVDVSTEPYRLGKGETIDTVAKKYHLSIDELKKNNIYRTFSKPFLSLTTGDEIEVPRKKSPFAVDNAPPSTLSSTENTLARHTVAGATALSNGLTVQSGERMVRSAVNNEFNSSAQQWLSQLGTARVQLNVNDDFTLEGSAVDVLASVAESKTSLLFTQLGARNKDSRNTVNIGIGARTFQNNWMYGANTFFDNDITGKNRRVGVGAEAWTDYLKLSANSYFGTTDWHQSRDFTNYDERPANGYDIRAEAYLPSHPQLGGKLIYEQYRGEEVALFGKDNRQKNPYALMAGINYTPIPLLTIGAEHRAGKDNQNDSSINAQLNYRLGESWQSHIAPSAVAATRTLAGSRYDLVERNNNIVLDYQKQDLIRLTLPESLTGLGGNPVTVTAQVTAKNGLDRIEWDTTSFIAAGGSMTATGKQSLTITLPAYQHAPSRSSGNTYTLRAMAYDSRGHVSNQAMTQIIVTPQQGSVSNSFTQANPNTLSADGLSTSQIIVSLRDSDNAPVSGVAHELALTMAFVPDTVQRASTSGRLFPIQLGEITESAAGQYRATLTAGTQPGTVVITPTWNALVLNTVSVNLLSTPVTAEITSTNLTVTRDGAVANGTATNEVQALVTDANGYPVSGQTVTFAANNSGTVTTVIGLTGADGLATATVSNTVAGATTVTASLNGNSQIVSTTFVAGEVTRVYLSVTRTSAVANGIDTNEVKARLTDANFNLVSGQTVNFDTTDGLILTAVNGNTTGADGIVTATGSSTESGWRTVTATTGNISSNSVLLSFSAIPAMTGASVNGYEFSLNAGFPSTGFIGAEFNLTMSVPVNRYTWSSSNTSWVTVSSSGKVTFTGKGDSSPVTITATPIAGGAPMTYTFTVTDWFINNGSAKMNWSNASNWCSTRGLNSPTRADLTQGRGIRGMGSLWSEWGNMYSYSSAGFVSSDFYWTSEFTPDNKLYDVNLSAGYSTSAAQDASIYVVCQQGL